MAAVRLSLCALALILCVACDEKQLLDDGGSTSQVEDASTAPTQDASAQTQQQKEPQEKLQVDASTPEVAKDASAAKETKDAGRLAKSVGHVQFQLVGVQ